MSGTVNFNIIHCEDDAADKRVMQNILKKMKYDGNYLHFSTSHALLGHINTHHSNGDKPDLIFLDIGLPGEPGMSVLSKIRNNPDTSTIPVIMLTGSNSIKDRDECIKIGCNGFLQKSGDLQQFADTVEHIIKSWNGMKSQRFF